MTYSLNIGGPGAGLFPDPLVVKCFNRSGAARIVGDVAQLDMGRTQSETDSNEPGDEGSVHRNCVLPATAFLQHGIFGIWQENTADNAEGYVLFRGVTLANVVGSNATARTDYLTAANGTDTLTSDVTATAAVGKKIIGQPLATTAAGTEEQISVLFNGIEGLGHDAPLPA